MALDLLRHDPLGHHLHHRLSCLAPDLGCDAGAARLLDPRRRGRRDRPLCRGQRAREADLASIDLATISEQPGLYNYAVRGGSAIFRTWCAQCHGAGAPGAPGGYPNLLDDDRLWGGEVQSIHDTVAHGVRAEQDPDTRCQQMPAFGDVLEETDIRAVVNYVMAISGQQHDAALADQGQQVFFGNCSACHGEQGTGDRIQGAPNLTDAIRLYGGDEETLFDTVS